MLGAWTTSPKLMYITSRVPPTQFCSLKPDALPHLVGRAILINPASHDGHGESPCRSLTDAAQTSRSSDPSRHLPPHLPPHQWTAQHHRPRWSAPPVRQRSPSLLPDPPSRLTMLSANRIGLSRPHPASQSPQLVPTGTGNGHGRKRRYSWTRSLRRGTRPSTWRSSLEG